MMDSPQDLPKPNRLENMANEITNLDLNEHEELELSKILQIASKRLSRESTKALVEALSRDPEISVRKIYENNTGIVLDYKFFKKQVYDGLDFYPITMF
jgi:hypothetical protein